MLAIYGLFMIVYLSRTVQLDIVLSQLTVSTQAQTGMTEGVILNFGDALPTQWFSIPVLRAARVLRQHFNIF